MIKIFSEHGNVAIRRGAFALVMMALLMPLTSCGDASLLKGCWHLEEYCYGTDCIMLADYGMVQSWTFDDDIVESGSVDGVSDVLRAGRLFQDSVMDDRVMWSLNSSGDSLKIYFEDQRPMETYYVTELDANTLVLSSMINNILVRQRFVRQ